VCPNCGESALFVTSVVLTYQGEEELSIHAPLEEGGFDFWDELTKRQQDEDCSTQDEVVTCGHCGVEFTLAELSLEDQHSFRFEVAAPVAYEGTVSAALERIALMKAMRQLEERAGARARVEDLRFK
jgi:hypothetical protein